VHRHDHSHVEVCGRRIEVRAIEGDPARPTLVFLHEGLGSVAMWRGFPARVAEVTGCPAVVYSRYGYGGSDLLAAPFGVDYMHREADEALPELLAKLGIAQSILIGHSDGASIALIYAGSHDGAVRGLVALAPHVFVEDLSVRASRSEGRIRDDRHAKKPRATTDARGRSTAERHLAASRLPAVEHRGVLAAHPLPGARGPGRRRRVRHDGADRDDRRARCGPCELAGSRPAAPAAPRPARPDAGGDRPFVARIAP
jgi:pimeloyl-ACP methyl ester carboxylesterase